jgi:hypothetical protein
VRGEVVVEPVRPRVHERAQPRRARRVQRRQLRRVDEQPLPQVGPHRALAVHLRQAAERAHVVALDAREVVLGLGVHEPEHRVGVGLAVDVRHAPRVADDGHARGARAPARGVRRRGRRGRARGRRGRRLRAQRPGRGGA